MKIALINKFFYRRRGAENVFFDEAELLESHGHEVLFFSMDHPQNQASEYSKYFVSNVELGVNRKRNLKSALKIAGRFIYSLEAKEKIWELLQDHKIDLVHIHNIYHHISPSILGEIKNFGIPIVMTVHDYKLICPNYILYTQGEICERCKGGKFHNAIKYKCLQNSALVSTLAAAEMSIHKWLKLYEKHVDIFITPSEFVRRKMIEFGQNPDRFVTIPHFIDEKKFHKISSKKQENSESFFFYAGALAKEKGIDLFVQKFYNYKGESKLKIAGDGPLLAKIKTFIEANNAQNRIELLGKLPQEKVFELMQESLAIVVPSVVHETFGLAALEAHANGKAVLASNLGGLPEIVEDGKSGYLFDIQSDASVLEVLAKAENNMKSLKGMGRYGQKQAKLKFNKEKHYKALNEVFEKLV